ncbi:MAG: hypothetical protein AB7O24_17675 [Kofleriaceae bacterium]
MSRTGVSILRLTALALAVGFTATRIGVVLHELLGHGAAAVGVGGEVTAVRLFWFAGGWVSYREVPADDGLIVTLAGIAVELVLGLGLWIGLRNRASLASGIVRTMGAGLILHGCWYLATGTWHGYGDGWMVHRELADQRWMVAIPAGVTCCWFAFAGAQRMFGPLAATVSGSRRVRVAGTLAAVVMGGAVHVAAAHTEMIVRSDAVYARVGRSEQERAVDRELAQWLADQRQRGMEPSASVRAETEAAIERRHRPFPFARLLLLASVLAAVVGVIRSPVLPAEREVSGRLLRVASTCAVVSLGMVIALDAVLS